MKEDFLFFFGIKLSCFNWLDRDSSKIKFLFELQVLERMESKTKCKRKLESEELNYKMKKLKVDGQYSEGQS